MISALHKPAAVTSLLMLTGIILLLLLMPESTYAHGMSEAEKQSIIDGGNWHYLWLGATHMLTGYDHLAFVFGIIFFLTSLRDIAKYVTAFTVGHSITLIYATFNAIQMNYFLIDAIIALSVCYIAFVNIDGFRKYLNIRPPNMLLMILGLGLIHGFGLSTRLQELPLSADQLLLNIIAFNVGIELGQISALALMLLVIASFRHSHFFQPFSTITNIGLILMGGLLFLMQMHGYEHSANAEELALSTSAGATLVEDSGTPISNVKSATTALVESIEIIIPARGDKEYKLRVQQSATLHYDWETDGEDLFFDFHADKPGDTSGFFESFKKATASRSAGSQLAPFSGNYGWYWKNYSPQPVSITLRVGGDYQRSDTLQKIDAPAVKKRTTHDTL